MHFATQADFKHYDLGGSSATLLSSNLWPQYIKLLFI